MSIMKKGFLLCIAVFGLLFAGCHSSDDTNGDWQKVAQIKGVAASGAVTFKIGNEVYVGLGYDKDIDPVFAFVKSSDGVSWQDVAPFPEEFGGRIGAVAFTIGTKAYVGTGYKPAVAGSTIKTFYKDFYCYDSETDSWSKISDDFGGEPRRNGIAFTLNVNGQEIGYFGCGSTNNDKEYLNDFWSFDGTTFKSEDSHGRKRNGGTAFVIDNVAYICLGYESGTQLAPDMIKFDGTNWTELNKLTDATDQDFDDDYTTICRAHAVSFIAKVNGETRGYIATGVANGTLTRYAWEYDPKIDRWDEVNQLPSRMSARVAGVGFSIGDYGYVTLGGTSTDYGAFDDTWRFVPGIEAEDKNDY